MRIAACIVPAAPPRKNPANESEMVSQLLFGELVELVEFFDSTWVRVICDYDQYEGWVSTAQIKEVNFENHSPFHTDAVLVYNTSLSNTIDTGSGKITIPQASFLRQFTAGAGEIAQINYTYQGNDTRFFNTLQPDRSFLEKLLEQWVNVPYLWGGRTMMGVDCSGFTQVVYRMMGVKILRDASQQATQGQLVDFLQEATCGDLAFFDDQEGKIYHVGILLNSNQIIHASGSVRIDNIDNAGIIQGSGMRTHQLRIIKRYF